MSDGSVRRTAAIRGGRILQAGVITFAIVAAVAGPAVSQPASAVRSVVSGDLAGSSGQWSPRPSLRQARAGVNAVTVDGQILAIAGFQNDRLFDDVEARSVTGTGTWHDVAPMPTARRHAATAALGGLAYAVGGYNQGAKPVDVVEIFNPRSGRWSKGLPLPQPRGGPGAAALDGLLYVAGGLIPLKGSGYEMANSMVAFDPARNTWRSVAPMPTARERFRLVASGAYLYAVGGFDLTGPSLSTVERYDPASDSWLTMNPMNESRVLPGVCETGVGQRRALVVVGGVEFSASGSLADFRRTTEVLDVGTGRWTLLNALLPVARGANGCATEADGTVLTIGGASWVAPGSPFVFLSDVDALRLSASDLR
jgi:hypothetical protein